MFKYYKYQQCQQQLQGGFPGSSSRLVGGEESRARKAGSSHPRALSAQYLPSTITNYFNLAGTPWNIIIPSFYMRKLRPRLPLVTHLVNVEHHDLLLNVNHPFSEAEDWSNHSCLPGTQSNGLFSGLITPALNHPSPFLFTKRTLINIFSLLSVGTDRSV